MRTLKRKKRKIWKIWKLKKDSLIKRKKTKTCTMTTTTQNKQLNNRQIAITSGSIIPAPSGCQRYTSKREMVSLTSRDWRMLIKKDSKSCVKSVSRLEQELV